MGDLSDDVRTNKRDAWPRLLRGKDRAGLALGGSTNAPLCDMCAGKTWSNVKVLSPAPSPMRTMFTAG